MACKVSKARSIVSSRHAAAEECDIRTADEIGWDDSADYKVGRLLVTSVFLSDVGLVGGTNGTASFPQNEFVNEAGLAEQLAGLGLPQTFGGAKVCTLESPPAAKGVKAKRHQKQRVLDGSTLLSGQAPIEPTIPHQPLNWQQQHLLSLGAAEQAAPILTWQQQEQQPRPQAQQLRQVRPKLQQRRDIDLQQPAVQNEGQGAEQLAISSGTGSVPYGGRHWVQGYDTNYSMYYYYNIVTQESLWMEPGEPYVPYQQTDALQPQSPSPQCLQSQPAQPQLYSPQMYNPQLVPAWPQQVAGPTLVAAPVMPATHLTLAKPYREEDIAAQLYEQAERQAQEAELLRLQQMSLCINSAAAQAGLSSGDASTLAASPVLAALFRNASHSSPLSSAGLQSDAPHNMCAPPVLTSTPYAIDANHDAGLLPATPAELEAHEALTASLQALLMSSEAPALPPLAPAPPAPAPPPPLADVGQPAECALLQPCTQTPTAGEGSQPPSIAPVLPLLNEEALSQPPLPTLEIAAVPTVILLPTKQHEVSNLVPEGHASLLWAETQTSMAAVLQTIATEGPSATAASKQEVRTRLDEDSKALELSAGMSLAMATDVPAPAESQGCVAPVLAPDKRSPEQAAMLMLVQDANASGLVHLAEELRPDEDTPLRAEQLPNAAASLAEAGEEERLAVRVQLRLLAPAEQPLRVALVLHSAQPPAASAQADTVPPAGAPLGPGPVQELRALAAPELQPVEQTPTPAALALHQRPQKVLTACGGALPLDDPWGIAAEAAAEAEAAAVAAAAVQAGSLQTAGQGPFGPPSSASSSSSSSIGDQAKPSTRRSGNSTPAEPLSGGEMCVASNCLHAELASALAQGMCVSSELNTNGCSEGNGHDSGKQPEPCVQGCATTAMPRLGAQDYAAVAFDSSSVGVAPLDSPAGDATQAAAMAAAVADAAVGAMLLASAGSAHTQSGTVAAVAAITEAAEAADEEGVDALAAAVSRVVLDPGTAAYVRTLMPRNVQKYWLQRYSLFARFDEGVQLDTEGWWSVTPQVAAQHQARMLADHVVGAGPHSVAMDAFAGCGGNVIQLAETFPHVVGVDISHKRLDMARHNAIIYGVMNKVDLLCGDFFKLAPSLAVDALFMSPPWGGPTYKHCTAFDVLETMAGFGVSIAYLLQVSLTCVARAAGVVAAFLPKNTDLMQLASLVPPGMTWHVERTFVNGKHKGITLYCWGPHQQQQHVA